MDGRFGGFRGHQAVVKVNGERRRKDGQVQMFSVNNLGATGVDELSEEVCPTHPDTGSENVKAHLGHHHTCNKQVIIRCCGIIYSCVIFFTAEAVSNVLVSVVVTD